MTTNEVDVESTAIVPSVRGVLHGVAVEIVAHVVTVRRKSYGIIATEGQVPPMLATLGFLVSERMQAHGGRKETSLGVTGILYPAVDGTIWATVNRGIEEKGEVMAVVED